MRYIYSRIIESFIVTKFNKDIKIMIIVDKCRIRIRIGVMVGYLSMKL